VGSDDRAVVAVELITHDDNVMEATLNVADAMATAEGEAGTADRIEAVGDVSIVVGVLVRQH
jgi:hypothetical protein